MIHDDPDEPHRERADGDPLRRRQRPHAPGVGPEHLHPEAAQRIPHQVEKEDVAVAQPPDQFPAEDHHQRKADQVPDRLVEEGRVEAVFGVPLSCGVGEAVGQAARHRRAGRLLAGVVRVDVERPGEGGGWPKELLVDAVAQPADGLRQQQAGDQDVQPARQLQVRRFAVPILGDADVDDHAEDAAQHRAVDAQPAEAAVPERDDVDRVLAVVGPARKVARRRREDVVQPGADDAQDEHPDQQVPDMLGVFAAALGLDGRDPGGHQCAEHDQQPVPVYLKWAEIEEEWVHGFAPW